jgi:cell division protein FtsQ
VDLSDPEDVKVLTNDPDGEVLVHLGSSNYLDRFKIYVAHLREWRQQFPKLESVDLRYDRQIIVNPDLRGVEHQTPLSAKAAKAAMAAGVKPTALIQHEPAKITRPVPAKISVLPPPAAKSALPKHVVTKAHSTYKPTAHGKAVSHRGATTNRASGGIAPARPAAARPPGSATAKPSPAIAKGQDRR